MKVPIYECCLKQTGEIDVSMKRMGSTYDLGKIAEELGYTEFAEEHTGMFCMNELLEIIGYHEVAHCTPNQCETRAADWIKRAILNNATTIAIVHNHPSQTIATPSKEDMLNYAEFEKKCAEFGITLIEGVVIAGDGKRGHKITEPFVKSILVAMQENGLLDEERARSVEATKIQMV